MNQDTIKLYDEILKRNHELVEHYFGDPRFSRNINYYCRSFDLEELNVFAYEIRRALIANQMDLRTKNNMTKLLFTIILAIKETIEKQSSETFNNTSSDSKPILTK